MIDDIEKEAIQGDSAAVAKIVELERQLRTAVHLCLQKRYSDGECDSVTLYDLQLELEHIEAFTWAE